MTAAPICHSVFGMIVEDVRIRMEMFGMIMDNL
jgi:hypothetical protein